METFDLTDVAATSRRIYSLINHYGYDNGLGMTLTNAVIQHKPSRIYEFGSGTGYTTLHLALGCYVNRLGSVITHDVFETESVGIFRPHPMKQYNQNIQSIPHLSALIQSNIANYNDWLLTGDTNFDLIYFDINNDGDKIIDIFTKLNIPANKGKILLFEGGHPNRSDVKYKNVTPIHHDTVKQLTNFTLIHDNVPGVIKIEL